MIWNNKRTVTLGTIQFTRGALVHTESFITPLNVMPLKSTCNFCIICELTKETYQTLPFSGRPGHKLCCCDNPCSSALPPSVVADRRTLFGRLHPFKYELSLISTLGERGGIFRVTAAFQKRIQHLQEQSKNGWICAQLRKLQQAATSSNVPTMQTTRYCCTLSTDDDKRKK